MIENGIQTFENYNEILAEWQKKYEHVIIDEFQDNNYLQTLFARKLAPKGHITVVGDEDQCIFTFQGANPKNFENFENHYGEYHPKDIILKTNYRSTKNIVQKSQLLLDIQPNRKKKQLTTNNELGSNVRVCEFYTEKKQFEWIRNEISERLSMKTRSLVQKNDIAVLFRTNKQKKRFEKSLTDELKGIEISTVHKSKGKEYSIVFIPNVIDGNFPMGFQIGSFPVPDSLKNNYENRESDFSSQTKEERRILYVGMTRAKKELILSFHTEKIARKSDFIDDMGMVVENMDSKDERPKKKEKWFESKKDEYKSVNRNKTIQEIADDDDVRDYDVRDYGGSPEDEAELDQQEEEEKLANLEEEERELDEKGYEYDHQGDEGKDNYS